MTIYQKPTADYST